MPQHRLLKIIQLAVEDPAHRVRRDEGAVGRADQDGGVKVADGDAEGEGVGAGKGGAVVEGAEAVGAQEIFFFGRQEGEERGREAQEGGGDARPVGEYRVCAGGAEVGQPHVSVHGGGCEEVRVAWVGGFQCKEVGVVEL